jgi:hypothetical protein
MKVRVSMRTNSYAIYVEKNDVDELGEGVMHAVMVRKPLWFKEVYDGRYKKIIVIP